jgi:hypothetical protein
MRSCLFQLLVTVAVVFALLWFGLPFGASWIATNTLNAAGFTGTSTKVDVAAKLPPRILLGHADTVRLTSTQVSVGDLHASAIDVTLADVELIDRTIGSVSGTLTGVRVPADDGGVLTADSVVLAGRGTDANATLTVSSSEVATLAKTQLKGLGVTATNVKLTAPDDVTLTVAGQTRTGHLVTKDGALQVVVASLTPKVMTLIETGNGNPFTFTSVKVSSASVTLVGTIDLQSLLGL